MTAFLTHDDCIFIPQFTASHPYEAPGFLEIPCLEEAVGILFSVPISLIKTPRELFVYKTHQNEQNNFGNHNGSFTDISGPQAYLYHACPEAFFLLTFLPLQTPLRFK